MGGNGWKRGNRSLEVGNDEWVYGEVCQLPYSNPLCREHDPTVLCIQRGKLRYEVG